MKYIKKIFQTTCEHCRGKGCARCNYSGGVLRTESSERR